MKTTSISKQKFTKLNRLYVIGLIAIALSVIVSQLIIRSYLKDQQSDSTLINIAGRQRMLSQKLTKEALLIQYEKSPEQRKGLSHRLSQTLKLWQTSHDNLLKGGDSLHLPGNNSNKVMALFQKMTPYYEQMSRVTEHIIQEIQTKPSLNVSALYSQVEMIKANEGPYLGLMNQIVYQYNREAEEKVTHLKHVELLLTAFILLVLLIEFLVIFWPTAKAINQAIFQLVDSEEKAIQMVYHANLLRESKEKSMQELNELTKVIDRTLLFARVTSEGTILHLGDKFSKRFNITELQSWTTFPEVISIHKDEQETIRNLLASYSNTGWQGEIKATIQRNETIWLEMHMIPFFFANNNRGEIIIVSSDITDRKKAYLEVEELTKKNFEEKMNQQKIISEKIIENQEKEHNRIAKDIHDGIGQMLTGLKFNLESIDLNNKPLTQQKIEQLKSFTADIIQGVRTATFNLTPPELNDYGIPSALSKLARELSRLTGHDITFFNKFGFDLRLDPLSEINIYRIVQEAVNNAIKYAQATYIVVTLSHSDTLLSITIDDDGIGLSPKKEAHKDKTYGGMGMMFMRERIKFVKGRIFINSIPDTGTRITLNIPLDRN